MDDIAAVLLAAAAGGITGGHVRWLAGARYGPAAGAAAGLAMAAYVLCLIEWSRMEQRV
jgi:hypothetical protein